MKVFAQDQELARAERNGPYEPADYCSREGAQALKERIEAYWRARGHDVMLSLLNVGFHPAIRAARFDVRSDMVNGMPRSGDTAKRENRPAMSVEAEDEDADDLWLE